VSIGAHCSHAEQAFVDQPHLTAQDDWCPEHQPSHRPVGGGGGEDGGGGLCVCGVWLCGAWVCGTWVCGTWVCGT